MAAVGEDDWQAVEVIVHRGQSEGEAGEIDDIILAVGVRGADVGDQPGGACGGEVGRDRSILQKLDAEAAGPRRTRAHAEGRRGPKIQTKQAAYSMQPVTGHGLII